MDAPIAVGVPRETATRLSDVSGRKSLWPEYMSAITLSDVSDRKKTLWPEYMSATRPSDVSDRNKSLWPEYICHGLRNQQPNIQINIKFKHIYYVCIYFVY
ncbi:rCG44707 [Rattus norvegicus]|uniref:RCG44707 n=1 Tax=Rattus norvegicus TaxID=10116 RepID=A6I500_RAT|nr:rCG44707 [Rattus norvegicus]